MTAAQVWACRRGVGHSDLEVAVAASGTNCPQCAGDPTYKGTIGRVLVSGPKVEPIERKRGAAPLAQLKEATVANVKTKPKRAKASTANGHKRGVEPTAEALADLLAPMGEAVARLRKGRKPSEKLLADVALACRRGYSMSRKLRGLPE